MSGFVVVRQFGARVGSDFAGSAFGDRPGTRPGIIRRILALLLMVILIVPVLLLFVLLAIVALALGIVVSLVSGVARAFRPRPARFWRSDGGAGDAHRAGYDGSRNASRTESPSDSTRGPLGRDRDGRENVRVATRR